MYACNGILFNHESPRRGETFVTRKITRGLANIAQGLEGCLYMGNMDALRDWGHAKDYVRMQWLMLQQEQAEDFVIATGHQHSVRDCVRWSARELGVEDLKIVQRLLFLGSSCIYPKLAPQPMREDALLTGVLEPTNEPYAIAKIAGIKLCESMNRQHGTDYRSVMPTNLYGPGDNFHPENSHVIPAMLQRFHKAVNEGAQKVVIWGSGTPMREFLHVDDMAAACLHVMDLPLAAYQRHTQPMLSHINVGTGVDCSISELAETMAQVTGFTGTLVFDTSKPDGTPRKLLDVSRLKALGWEARIPLREGLEDTYRWYLERAGKVRG